MATQVLKDRLGNKIGEIRENGNILTIHDKLGNKLGEYRTKQNTTHDKLGNKIGSGNLLTTFL